MHPSARLLATLVCGAAAALAPRPAASAETTLYGPTWRLTKGANALQAGRARDGIRITLAAMDQPLSDRNAGAAYSNLCAGYVLLGLHLEAIDHCNEAERLSPGNWRIYNNRSLAHQGVGRHDDAIEDLRRAVALRPGSERLMERLREALARGPQNGRAGSRAPDL